MKEIKFSELLQMIDERQCPKVVSYNGERFEYVNSLKAYVDNKKKTSLLCARMKSMNCEGKEYLDGILSDFTVGFPDVLDEVETRYLRNLIKPFKNDVHFIEKVEVPNLNSYRIKIHIKGIQIISLPLFPKDANMYVGMELFKNYSVADLGL